MKSFLLIILAVVFLSEFHLFAQTTNVIPTNLFITDDGLVFWYKSTGERVIHIFTIKHARDSRESQPADKDPEDNWGSATNGFQLSLRFEKNIFTNGEPMIATMLMRNISSQPQQYFRPTRIIAMKDGQQLSPKNDTDLIKITMSPEMTIYPQTQHKYQVDLSQEYDLSTNGEYFFRAVCRNPTVFSQQVSVLITNHVTQ